MNRRITIFRHSIEAVRNKYPYPIAHPASVNLSDAEIALRRGDRRQAIELIRKARAICAVDGSRLDARRSRRLLRGVIEQ